MIGGWRPMRAADLDAVVAISDAVHGVFTEEMPVTITQEWREFVEALDLPEDVKDALVDPERVDDAIDSFAIDDPLFARYAHAVTHMTVSPNMLRSGVKANVIASEALANIAETTMANIAAFEASGRAVHEVTVERGRG